MNKRELNERHVALAAALLETRPFISEVQYHRMKKNRDSPGFYLILQWENCVHSVCRALHRMDDDLFTPEQFLIASGFVSAKSMRIH